MSEATTETNRRGGDQSERARLLRQAYGTANTRLREAHRSEFDELYSLAAEELGVTYTPRLTAEQKAEQELKDLLEKHPHLADKVIEERHTKYDDDNEATNI